MYNNIIADRIKRNIIITEDLLMESGIKIPAGSTSAKVLYHSDLDGLFSAILTVNQLEKQGIKKDRITVKPVQYGNDKEELYGDTFGKKGQAVCVVDFAALPTGNAFESLNSVLNYKMDKNKFIAFVKKYESEFKTISEKAFKEKFLSEFSIAEKDIKPKNMKGIGEAYRALKHFDFDKLKGKELGDFKTAFETKLNNPDFASDHHDNAKDDLTPGKSGKIGATGFKSDAEHVSTTYAPNLASYSDIKAVSVVDSASYEDLENTILLNKKFREKGRMERLATITATLIGQIIKKNKDIAAEIILNSSPSLVSVYNNTLKFGKYNDTQLKMYEEMKKDKPNWESINGMKDTLPKRLQKNYTDKDKYKNIKPLLTLDQWREKGIKDMEKALTGFWSRKEEELLKASQKEGEGKEKALELLISQTENSLGLMGKQIADEAEGTTNKRIVLQAMLENRKSELAKLKAENKELPTKLGKKDKESQFTRASKSVIMRQDIKNPKDQASRFAGSLLEKDGMLSPFVLRRWGTMLQVAVNPQVAKQAPEAMKGVNLGALANQILDELEAEFKAKKEFPWFMPIIKKESGGHKSITTISALATIGLAPAPERERLEELKAVKTRVTNIGKKFDKMMPAKDKEIRSLELSKKEHAKKREEAMDFIEKRFNQILWEKYKDVKVAGTGKYKLDSLSKDTK